MCPGCEEVCFAKIYHVVGILQCGSLGVTAPVGSCAELPGGGVVEALSGKGLRLVARKPYCDSGGTKHCKHSGGTTGQ